MESSLQMQYLSYINLQAYLVDIFAALLVLNSKQQRGKAMDSAEEKTMQRFKEMTNQKLKDKTNQKFNDKTMPQVKD